MANEQTFDAIIVGGGPAGSTAGAVLADHGRRVAILEKETFPRYHIGESLLPYCYFPLERIGMIDKLNRAHFVKKYSVQFANMDGKISQPFYFFKHIDHAASQTWQVWRSEFDQMLLDNAREKGASIHQPMAARQLLTEDGAVAGVVARDDRGASHTFTAPITIDATGRDGFAINRFGWRIRDPQLAKIAIWTYYRRGLRDPGLDEGATTIAYLPDKGWFWYIPLPDDIVSVGITAERDYLYRDGKDPAAILQRQIPVNKWIEAHLAPAEQFGQYWATGDYSYRSKYCAGDGLVLTGDAFAFLDPVFSSGVFLALRSGEMVGDAAHEALGAGDVTAGRFSGYAEELIAGIEAMRKLVYAFYDHRFSFRQVLRNHPHLRKDLTDCLIGNLFRDFGELFNAVAEFADVPAELPHGRPGPGTPDGAARSGV